MSNWRCTQPDHSCSWAASAAGAPSTAAMVSEGYGLPNAATNSQSAAPPRSCHSPARKPRIAGRHRSAARGVNAGLTRPAQPAVPLSGEVEDVGVDLLAQAGHR